MTDINIKQISVTAACTLREALRRLDDTGQGILLLVGGNEMLLRTITDGDLRRLMLAGASLDDRLEVLPEHQAITAPAGISAADAVARMRSAMVDKLPLLDAAGRVAGLLRLADIEPPILLSTPHMGEQELEFVNQAFSTNWIAPLGPNVDACEKELADMVGVGHASALSSGTAAIHLALVLLDVKRGDTVFCSSFTFVASANPILYQGARPDLIDSEPDSWNMSPQALERALLEAEAEGTLPRAVIVVNLYGQSADMDPILALCDRFGVPVIEDAAESLGASYKGRESGSLGHIGVFSFNGNKIITTSGGGMLVSSDAGLVERSRFLATQARDDAPYYLHTEMGYNYRMSNVLAGIGRGQLRVLAQRIDTRRAVFERYREGLGEIEGISWMPEASFGRSTRWLSCCQIDPQQTPISVEELIDALAAQRIEARRTWKPMHQQPLFEGSRYYPHAEDVSVCDQLFSRGLCLPSGSNMTEEQQARVIKAFKDAMGTQG
jgi:dTDP-4-amino-4,6-dideoxygalactose transaminase